MQYYYTNGLTRQNTGHYSFIEMFAGQAEATRMMRYAGHCAAKLDYKYHVAAHGKQNFMDILTPSGFLHLGPVIHLESSTEE